MRAGVFASLAHGYVRARASNALRAWCIPPLPTTRPFCSDASPQIVGRAVQRIDIRHHVFKPPTDRTDDPRRHRGAQHLQRRHRGVGRIAAKEQSSVHDMIICLRRTDWGARGGRTGWAGHDDPRRQPIPARGECSLKASIMARGAQTLRWTTRSVAVTFLPMSIKG